MLETIAQFHPILQALLRTTFTWGMTAAGAATIFLRKTLGRKVLDTMLGFAAGVMIAASYWSLLAPALSLTEQGPIPAYVPAAVGFLLGGACLRGLDMILPHLHIGAEKSDREGIQTTWRRTTLLILAITLHSVPEGLAVGVAFGAAAVTVSRAILPYALAFAAGAMIFVVVEDLIPEAHREGNADLATMGAMFGFTVMMILDVALG